MTGIARRRGLRCVRVWEFITGQRGSENLLQGRGLTCGPDGCESEIADGPPQTRIGLFPFRAQVRAERHGEVGTQGIGGAAGFIVQLLWMA